MNLLDELREDFGLQEPKQVTIALGNFVCTVAKIPSYLYPTFAELQGDIPKNSVTIACSIIQIQGTKLTDLFTSVLPESTNKRIYATHKLVTWLEENLPTAFIEDLYNRIIQEIPQDFASDADSLKTVFEDAIKDEELHIRLYLMTHLGWTPSKLAEFTNLQLYAVYYYHNKTAVTKKDEDFDRLGQHLGTYWTAEDAVSLNSNSNNRVDNIIVPLSLVIAPDLKKEISKRLNIKGARNLDTGLVKSRPGEELVELDDYTPEEFRAIAKGNLPPSMGN